MGVKMKEYILVPVDGSEQSVRAVRFAVTMAKGMQSEIVLLNVQPCYNTPNVKRFFSKDQIRELQEEMGEEALQSALQAISESEIPFSKKIRIGVPVEKICAEAKELNATCIVMGSRGLGPMQRTLLGSVSYNVLHEALRPVVIVP